MLRDDQNTVPSPDRDYPEWHRGRQRYALWLVRLECDEIRTRIAAAREHLTDLLQRPYCRQPHITLFVCGFPAEAPRWEDDYGEERFRLHEQALRNAAAGSFEVEIGGLDSFASAPFLEVRDHAGGLEAVRKVLAGTSKEIGRESGFVPHVTVGLYTGAFPGRAVRKKLEELPRDPCTITIDRVTFAHYNARELAGPLTYQHEVLLSRPAQLP